VTARVIARRAQHAEAISIRTRVIPMNAIASSLRASQ